MFVCLLCFASLVFLAASTTIGTHSLSVERRGLTFPLVAFYSARPPLITRLGTASANGSTKSFGEPFSCYCTDVVFLRIDGRKCWLRLFTPSDRSSACLLMKRPRETVSLPRRYMNGMALLSWVLTLGTVLLRRHVLRKGDPFCDPVELVEGNPTYSVVRLPDGKESTVTPSDSTPSFSRRKREPA